MAVLWRVLLAVAIVTCCPHSSQAVTHIVQIVADDLGYQDIGLFNDGKTLTPYLNKMVSQEGMWLSDYYTFKICAPTRASLMTGRYPWSIGYYDMKEDPRHCVNQTYTMLPAALKELGYRTVALGKWDVGFVHRNCTPTERGFDTFLGYYSACTADYWYHGNPFGHVGTDFSDSNGTNIQGAPMSGAASLNGTYDRVVFTDQAVDAINKHDPSQGLYLYVAFHNVHDACTADRFADGLNAPKASVDLYETTILDTWKVQAAMTTELDYGVGNITEALRANNMWDDTLIIFVSDNGGPLDHSNNAPLRGGKAMRFEGGFRVASFLSGGVLPAALRGTKWPGIAHSSDWYSTIVQGVLGRPLPPDGPRPHDGINLWPNIISGNKTSPRTTVIHELSAPGDALAGAIRFNHYKLIVGSPGKSVIQAWPNVSATPVPFGQTHGHVEPGTDHCRAPLLEGVDASAGSCKPYCLYHLIDDPQETTDLAGNPKYKAIAERLLSTMVTARATAPPRSYAGSADAEKQVVAQAKATGFLEPLDWH
eukprot:m.10785 g.10785  ORF g.10785 m.10785 type:complete len:536 (-) comp3858_c0_seq1:56-1663(-)